MVAASTMSSLALASDVYEQTGSALLSALALFGPSLVQILGASTFMSMADASPPRRTLIRIGAVVTAVVVCQAVLPLSPPGRLALTFAAAYVASLGTGARWGLLSQLLPDGAYALARSAMNVAVGAFQVVGFATSGLLLQVLSIREVFALSAVLSAIAVPILWFGLSEQSPRRANRPGLRETWRGNHLLIGQRHVRPVLVALCVPNGLIVGCEALLVPYAGSAAGVLFAAGALGMMCGDILVGRLLAAGARRRAATLLRLLLAVPFAPFVLRPDLPVAAVLIAVGSVGYGASLAQQELLVALAPADVQGQALGLESSARMTVQGICAVLAGAIADMAGVAATITLLAMGSLAVSALLTPALARAAAHLATVTDATGVPGSGPA